MPSSVNRNPFGAFCDHDELHRRDDEEDDEAHYQIAADDKFTEALDDVTRLGIEQNRLRGGDVEREAKERREQE